MIIFPYTNVKWYTTWALPNFSNVEIDQTLPPSFAAWWLANCSPHPSRRGEQIDTKERDRILKVYREPLTGFSHIFCPDCHHLSCQGYIL